MIRPIRGLAILLCLLLATSSASAAYLQLLPSSPEGMIGAQRTVDVRIVDVDPLRGVGAFDFFVAYDPAVLALAGALGGTSLGPASTGLMTAPAAGSVELFEVSFEAPADLLASQTSAFMLATLTFDLIGVGTSALDVLLPLLTDVDGTALTLAATQPSTLTVQDRATVPEPGMLLLLCGGLLVLAWSRNHSRGAVRRSRLASALALVAATQLAAPLAAAATCDVNSDGSIDVTDVNLILAARNAPTSGASDPRDANADGKIDITDARACGLRCTRPGCTVAPPANGSSAVIGPAGGSVVLADGARVDVPPGALATQKTISVKQIPLPPGSILPLGGKLVGKVYSFEPNGQVFAVPVKITIPYDAAIPVGYAEGAVSVYRQENGPVFNMVGDEAGDLEAESARQVQNVAAKRITVNTTSFSAYGAIAVNTSAHFVPTTLTAGTNATLVVKVPRTGGLRTTAAQRNFCQGGNTAQVNLATRTAADIQAIVLHSTNNGNAGRSFDGELGWANDSCGAYFAHYYVDRDGQIYQVADDTRIVQHTRPSTALGIGNPNSIGIEIFNNTGEPYDGRMVSSVTRLVDFLMERYNLPRPQRDAFGVVVRNPVNIAAGGDRIVSHAETDVTKCDPVGTFRSSATLATVTLPAGCGTAAVAGGSAGAPALIDMLVDAIAVLHRGRQHTGVINTSGGDARGMALPGNGGNVTLMENPTAVATAVGNTTHTQHTQNAPLIVAAGNSRNLTGTVAYTDALIAGEVTVTGPFALNLSGSFYLAPTGKIILREGASIALRGTPLIQGLIDATGADSRVAGTAGKNGGAVSFYSAAPGLLLVPTIITRGGDAQVANPTLNQGQGGRGGAITVQLGAASTPNLAPGSVFVGGGTGPRADAMDPASARPAIRADLDPVDLSPPEYIGDRLPVFPPFYYSSIGTIQVADGQQIPLRTFAGQAGFKRGLLTSGGFGGGGAGTALTHQRGAKGGDGGSINIGVGAGGFISLRDVDLITGADAEMATTEIVLPEGGARRFLFLVPAGGAGGKGRLAYQLGSKTGGDGGPGGAAGNIAVQGTLNPAPASFQGVGGVGNPGDIIGFDSRFRLWTTDDLILDFIIGRAIEARSATGNSLYRLRLDFANRPLGGSGGSPSGGLPGEFPGSTGHKGDSGTLTGLPVQ